MYLNFILSSDVVISILGHFFKSIYFLFHFEYYNNYKKKPDFLLAVNSHFCELLISPLLSSVSHGFFAFIAMCIHC